MSAFGGWDDDDEDEDRPPPPMDQGTADRVVRSFRIVRYVNLGLLLVAVLAIALLAWLTSH